MSAAALVSAEAAVSTTMAEEQAVVDAVETLSATVAAPTVTYEAPAVMYMQPQPIQYVTADGQPMQYVMEQPIQYVMQHPAQYEQPIQYVMEQPVQYVTADGQLVSYVDQPLQQHVTADGQPVSYVDPGSVLEYAAPVVQYVQQQPSVFNVSPETFAKLAQGGALSQEEVDAMTGATAAAPVEAAAEVVEAVGPEANQAVTSATASKKEKSSQKKALSTKKKSKGCC